MKTDFSKPVALKKYRLAKGFTQRLLAERLGCSASFICDLEKGRRSTKNTLFKKKLERALTP